MSQKPKRDLNPFRWLTCEVSSKLLRELSMALHPDVQTHPAAEKVFKQLSEVASSGRASDAVIVKGGLVKWEGKWYQVMSEKPNRTGNIRVRVHRDSNYFPKDRTEASFWISRFEVQDCVVCVGNKWNYRIVSASGPAGHTPESMFVVERAKQIMLRELLPGMKRIRAKNILHREGMLYPDGKHLHSQKMKGRINGLQSQVKALRRWAINPPKCKCGEIIELELNWKPSKANRIKHCRKCSESSTGRKRVMFRI